MANENKPVRDPAIDPIGPQDAPKNEPGTEVEIPPKAPSEIQPPLGGKE